MTSLQGTSSNACKILVTRPPSLALCDEQVHICYKVSVTFLIKVKETMTKSAANGIGWFSIGLGMTQLLAPNQLGRMIGVGKHPVAMRALGVREIASGIGVLAQRRPRASLLARVAGDALDLALLLKMMGQRDTQNERVAGAAAIVLAAGVMDYLCAQDMSEEVSDGS